MTDTAANTFIPRPLRALAGRALEGALNRVVALDPATRDDLKGLEGRRVQLHLCGPELALAIIAKDGRLKVKPPADAADAALHVSASPGGVLGMVFHAGSDTVSPGKVNIAGDAELARRLEKLARGYAPDFEEAFAHYFGDVLGVPLARALQRALAHARDSGRHVVEDTTDWLREESRLAVPAAEMDDFLDQVDDLREHVERLEARLSRLAGQPDPAT